MSAIEELMGYKNDGIEYGILGRAILEIIERLEALEYVYKSVVDREEFMRRRVENICKKLSLEPAPAPDLDALVENYVFKFIHNFKFSNNDQVRALLDTILRAFAAELEYKS